MQHVCQRNVNHTHLPASSFMNTTGVSNILSQCFLPLGLKSSEVNDSNSANLKTQTHIRLFTVSLLAYQDCNGDLCSPCCLWSTSSNLQCPPISPCSNMFSLKRPLQVTIYILAECITHNGHYKCNNKWVSSSLKY